MKPLDREYTDTVCKLGQLHECCRYLVGTQVGLACAKFTELKEHLDERVRQKTITARGDNCEGKP